jgi:flavin-dependent dehydrogenase
LLIGEKASLSLSFPLWAEVDVMVLGGGPSGFAAALTAAEMGARTLLVEQHGFLGGMATAALVMPWNVWAKPVTTKDIGGVYGKLIGLLDKREGSFRFSPQTVLRSFHPAILKMGMDEMAIQAGVKILFHTLAVDTLREKERITAVVLQNKAGRGIVKAKTIAVVTTRDPYFLDGRSAHSDDDRLSASPTLRDRQLASFG